MEKVLFIMGAHDRLCSIVFMWLVQAGAMGGTMCGSVRVVRRVFPESGCRASCGSSVIIQVSISMV